MAPSKPSVSAESLFLSDEAQYIHSGQMRVSQMLLTLTQQRLSLGLSDLSVSGRKLFLQKKKKKKDRVNRKGCGSTYMFIFLANYCLIIFQICYGHFLMWENTHNMKLIIFFQSLWFGGMIAFLLSCNHHQHQLQNMPITPKETPLAAMPHIPSLLASVDLFSISMELPVRDILCTVHGIIPHVTYCDWLLSLDTFPRFFHVITCIRSSLLFMAK